MCLRGFLQKAREGAMPARMPQAPAPQPLFPRCFFPFLRSCQHLQNDTFSLTRVLFFPYQVLLTQLVRSFGCSEATGDLPLIILNLIPFLLSPWTCVQASPAQHNHSNLRFLLLCELLPPHLSSSLMSSIVETDDK